MFGLNLGGRASACIAAGIVLLSLMFPAVVLGSSAGETMYEPEQIELGSRKWGSFLNEGTDPGEPLTAGSGTSCPENDGWTFDFTRWYYFWGTGEPVVVRADGGFDVGIAVYEEEPTIKDMLICREWVPRRYQFETKLGTLYRVQVGNWYDHEFGGLTGPEYVVSLFPVTPYGTRWDAMFLNLNGIAHMDSWGAPVDSAGCSSSEGLGFSGDRSAWGLIEIPSTGKLKVEVEPERKKWQTWMVLIYPLGSDFPTSCAVGGEPTLSTYLTKGPYLLQATRAVQPRVDEEGSVEEGWTVKTFFEPDVDEDGYLKSEDCNDADPTVHRGAEDVPDDGIDQNCDGSDAHGDTDGDLVPDYRDRCPRQPTRGVDANEDGCPDPRQMSLIARLLLTVHHGHLHVASMAVRATAGAIVALSCDRNACEQTTRRAKNTRLQLRERFDQRLPNDTVVTVTARKAGSVGIEKSYRLSTHGVRLLHERCTLPSRPVKVVKCE